MWTVKCSESVCSSFARLAHHLLHSLLLDSINLPLFRLMFFYHFAISWRLFFFVQRKAIRVCACACRRRVTTAVDRRREVAHIDGAPLRRNTRQPTHVLNAVVKNLSRKQLSVCLSVSVRLESTSRTQIDSPLLKNTRCRFFSTS